MPCFNKLDAVIQIRSLHAAALAHQAAIFERPLEPRRSGKARGTSIIELIACRQQLHGQKVRVSGYMVLHIEHVAIYLSEQDAKHYIMKNAIGIEVPDLAWKERGQYHEKYVLVEGTFDAGFSSGELFIYSGRIRDVVRLETRFVPSELQG